MRPGSPEGLAGVTPRSRGRALVHPQGLLRPTWPVRTRRPQYTGRTRACVTGKPTTFLSLMIRVWAEGRGRRAPRGSIPAKARGDACARGGGLVAGGRPLPPRLGEPFQTVFLLWILGQSWGFIVTHGLLVLVAQTAVTVTGGPQAVGTGGARGQERCAHLSSLAAVQGGSLAHPSLRADRLRVRWGPGSVCPLHHTHRSPCRILLFWGKRLLKADALALIIAQIAWGVWRPAPWQSRLSN